MAFRLGLFLVLIVALIAVSIFGVSVLNKSNHRQLAVAPATEQILVANGLL
jgi:pilus assembly protein CpaB